MDYNDSKDNSIIKEKAEDGTTKPGSVFQMMNQIQSLIKMTVEKAKQEVWEEVGDEMKEREEKGANVVIYGVTEENEPNAKKTRPIAISRVLSII